MDTAHILSDERLKVAALLAKLEQYGVTKEDEDASFILDAIEGETSAMEAVSAVLRQIGEDEARATALKALEAAYAARRRRYEDRVQNQRKGLLAFMVDFGLKKIERPEGTLSWREGSQKVSYAADFDPSTLEPNLRRITYAADAKAIKDTLDAGGNVPGAFLTNGEPSLTVRRS